MRDTSLNRRLKTIRALLLVIATFSFLYSASCSNKTTSQTPAPYLNSIVDVDGSLKRITSSKVLRVGTDINLGMPYINKSGFGSNYEGFEYEIAEQIAQELGCTVEIVPTNWGNLLPNLEKDFYDIALNTLEKTEDDKNLSKNTGFSNPYYSNSQQIAVLKDNKQVKFLNSLQNKTVGFLSDSSAHAIISQLNELKNTKINPKPFSTPDEMFEALKSKSIDAVISDMPIISWYCKDEKNNCKKVGFPLFYRDYRIAVKKEDRALLNGIDTVIRESLKSGKLSKILTKWDLE